MPSELHRSGVLHADALPRLGTVQVPSHVQARTRSWWTHSVRPRGYIFAEVVVCIPIIGLMVALAARGILSYSHSRNVAAARQAAAWAAAAQLERFQAGAPLDSLPPPGVIPRDVELTTTSAPGQAKWEGFQLVTVTGTVAVNERQKVIERIGGYVRTEVKP